jgi:putative PIN family toxin of toxin-antitoxin system
MLVSAPPLLEEIARVLARPKLVRKYGFTTADTRDILNLIERNSVKIMTPFLPQPDQRFCRDPNDDVFVQLAIAASSDVIVSADKDLYADQPLRDLLAHLRVEIEIVPPWDFLSKLGLVP